LPDGKTDVAGPTTNPIDLTDLLFGLLRERSFNSVLEAFAEACARGARQISEDLEAPDVSPAAKAQYERELDFFECATEHLRLARVTIENDAEIRATAPTESMGLRLRIDGEGQ
jgi:hypothetical protein